MDLTELLGITILVTLQSLRAREPGSFKPVGEMWGRPFLKQEPFLGAAL